MSGGGSQWAANSSIEVPGVAPKGKRRSGRKAREKAAARAAISAEGGPSVSPLLGPEGAATSGVKSPSGQSSAEPLPVTSRLVPSPVPTLDAANPPGPTGAGITAATAAYAAAAAAVYIGHTGDGDGDRLRIDASKGPFSAGRLPLPRLPATSLAPAPALPWAAADAARPQRDVGQLEAAACKSQSVQVLAPVSVPERVRGYGQSSGRGSNESALIAAPERGLSGGSAFASSGASAFVLSQTAAGMAPVPAASGSSAYLEDVEERLTCPITQVGHVFYLSKYGSELFATYTVQHDIRPGKLYIAM